MVVHRGMLLKQKIFAAKLFIFWITSNPDTLDSAEHKWPEVDKMHPPLIQSPLHIAAIGTLVRWWEYLRSHVLSVT